MVYVNEREREQAPCGNRIEEGLGKKNRADVSCGCEKITVDCEVWKKSWYRLWTAVKTAVAHYGTRRRAGWALPAARAMLTSAIFSP